MFYFRLFSIRALILYFAFLFTFSCLDEEITKENISGVIFPLEIFNDEGTEKRTKISLTNISPRDAVTIKNLRSYKYFTQPSLPEGVYIENNAGLAIVISKDAKKMARKRFQLTIEIPNDNLFYKGKVSTSVDISIFSLEKKTISGNINVSDTITLDAGVEKYTKIKFSDILTEGDREQEKYSFVVKKKDNSIPRNILFDSTGIRILQEIRVKDSGDYTFFVKARENNTFSGEITKEVSITVNKVSVSGDIVYNHLSIPLVNNLKASSFPQKKTSPRAALTEDKGITYQISKSSPVLPTGILINSSTGEISVDNTVSAGSNTYEIIATYDSDDFSGSIQGEIFIDIYAPPKFKKENSYLITPDKNTFYELRDFSIESTEKIKEINLSFSTNESLEIAYREDGNKTNILQKKNRYSQKVTNISGIDILYDSKLNKWSFQKDNLTVGESQSIVSNFLVKNLDGNDTSLNINIFTEKNHRFTNDYIFLVRKLDENTFVGATNIAATTADIVLSLGSLADLFTSHEIYISTEYPRSILDAKKGTLKKTITDGSLRESISGLTKYTGHYVSVVSKIDGKESLIALYGFVTGAKMYWDATVPTIATNRAGYWLNIASSGADYDGAIGNNGADYTYNPTDKAFENSDNDKNITFNEITAIKALFLVAQIDNNQAFLGGHNGHKGWQYFHPNTANKNLVLANHGSIQNDWDENAEFWIGTSKVTQPDFNRVDGEVRVYGARTKGTSGALKANQTGGNANPVDRVWKGKYQKYLIFDGAGGADPISKSEVADISVFLETDRRGGIQKITGNISYSEINAAIPIHKNLFSDVNLDSVFPSGARSENYTYSLEEGVFVKGITLSASTGKITVDHQSIGDDDLFAEYMITAQIVSEKYEGELSNLIGIKLYSKYIGVTNISDTGASFVFSRIDDYDTYEIYTNEFKSKKIEDVKNGNYNLEATVTSSDNFKQINSIFSKYGAYNVSVIAKKQYLKDFFVGSYSFVTGAKMYWDATVPLITTSRAGHWFNIASSGADYDGAIGGSGTDYSYNSSDEAFENSADDKNITYKEITDISAVFLVAKVDSDASFIAAHSGSDFYFHPDDFSGASGDIVASNDASHDNVKNGDFWLGATQKTRATFRRDGSGIKVYAIRTAGPGMKANQTQHQNQIGRVWKGKYQKYLIFDGYPSSGSNPMTKAQAANISGYLEEDRIGKKIIRGNIFYKTNKILLPLDSLKTIAVDKSNIYPIEARNKKYIHTSDDSFISGIALNRNTGEIYISQKIDSEFIKDYSITAEIQDDAFLGGVTGTLKIILLNKYVGATNISDTGGSAVFSRLDGYGTYDVYLNNGIVKTAADADDGEKAGTITSNDDYVVLTKTLSRYVGTNISVVASETGKADALVGSYGFVTGAKMYWDATISAITISRGGHWLNIASSGADYDGAIGNNGADYTYNPTDKAFENSDNDKNITFKEITAIKALFLVAQIDNNQAFLGGHNGNNGWQYFHPNTANKNLVLANHGSIQNDWDENAEFWIGTSKVTQPDFNRVDGEVRVYGARTTSISGALKANQTGGNANPGDRVWKGKYQKYLIFDGASGANAITENQVENISIFLEEQRKGKVTIRGSISYGDVTVTIPLDNNKTFSVDLTSVIPTGAQSETFSYSLNGGSFASGISLNSSTGEITFDKSINQEFVSIYEIEAEVQGSKYDGSLLTKAEVEIFNRYVGATNISDTGGNAVFSRLDGYGTYDVYLNDGIVKTAADADDGEKAGTITSNDDYVVLTKTLSRYVGTNISVVASETGKVDVLVGSYGFVTGAKMYWDATISAIAISRAGHWLNIASSGADYDGAIGGSGTDYSYNSSDEAFENSANNKNISFTEITDITALFLVAKLQGSNNFLTGHTTLNHFNADDFLNVGDLIADNGSAHANVTNGHFWIGGVEKSLADFERDTSSFRVYGLRTAGSGMKANQTKDRNHKRNRRVWKGKYQKYLIFDGYPSSGSNPITKTQAENISIFLETQLVE